MRPSPFAVIRLAACAGLLLAGAQWRCGSPMPPGSEVDAVRVSEARPSQKDRRHPQEQGFRRRADTRVTARAVDAPTTPSHSVGAHRAEGPDDVRDAGAALRSPAEARSAPAAPDRDASARFALRSDSRVQLVELHAGPGALDLVVEGRDSEAGRDLVLWRLDSPRGVPVRLAHARGHGDGSVYFGPLLLPETGARLAAAPAGWVPTEDAAWDSPVRAPAVPLLACGSGRVHARAPGPGHGVLVADARGIPFDPTEAPAARSFDSSEPPVRVATLRADGVRSSWLDLDPAHCAAPGGPR